MGYITETKHSRLTQWWHSNLTEWGRGSHARLFHERGDVPSEILHTW